MIAAEVDQALEAMPEDVDEATENQLESLAAARMREYRVHILREFGPYSDINLQGNENIIHYLLDNNYRLQNC